MMSGGTRPSTRSITKNGAPSGAGSGSDQRTRGTGTTPSAAISRITRNWRSMSYSGKTGTAPGSGATRATSRSRRRAPPSPQASSKSSVSLDMPFVDGPSTGETSGAATAPSRAASQRSSRSRSSPRSRVEVRGRAIAPPSPPIVPAPSPTCAFPSGPGRAYSRGSRRVHGESRGRGAPRAGDPGSARGGSEEARGGDRVDVLADLRHAALAEDDDEAVPVLVLGVGRAGTDPRLGEKHVAVARGGADLGPLRARREDPVNNQQHQVDDGVTTTMHTGKGHQRQKQDHPDEVVGDEHTHHDAIGAHEHREVNLKS